MPAWRDTWRHLRRMAGGLLAAVVIMLAVAMALGQLLLPLLQHYPHKLAILLSERLHQPVSLGSVRGQWQPSGPLFTVTDMRIGDGRSVLTLPAAALKVDFGAWLKPDRRWLELRVRGAHARLQADQAGVWHLSGIRVGDNGANERDGSALGDLPVGLLLRDMDLALSDPRHAIELNLHVPALRILTRNDRLHLGGLIRQPQGGRDIALAAWFDPAHERGRLYLGGRDIDLAAWNGQLGVGDMRLTGGHGRARLWLGWQAGRIDHLAADLDLADVALGRNGQSLLALPRWQGQLSAGGNTSAWQLQWQQQNDKGRRGRLVLHRRASGAVFARASDLDLASLAPWLALWPHPSGEKAPLLARLRPYGTLTSLALDWRDRSHFSLRAQLQGAGWAAVGGMPGVDRLDARVEGDGQAVSLQLPDQAVSVRVPGVFRKPFDLAHVHGVLSAWPTPDGWRAGSDDLELEAADYRVQLRGTLSGGQQGRLPTLDVAARVRDAQVTAAKLFWPVNVMPPGTVDWLDRALVSGRVEGRALFRGHLRDWPFPQGRGRFEAFADFRDAVLDYSPDWPGAEGLDGRAEFINNAMHIRSDAGRSLGNTTESAHADIEDFGQAPLELGVRGKGDAAPLLGWLRKTPVGKAHAEALDAMRASGPVHYGLNLVLPLGDAYGAPRLDGRADLAGVQFAVPEWTLQLDDLRGPLSFDTGGLSADALQGRYQGVPVTLAARVGEATGVADLAVAASMQGRFTGNQLLAGHPDLSAIAAVTRGQADFDIGLRIPAADADPPRPQRLTVDSGLQGMALELPAPLGKPADRSLPLHLALDLPSAGGRLHLRLGDIADARLRLPAPDRPLAADIALSGEASAADAAGLHLHGQADRLDIDGWLQQLAGQPAASSSADAGPMVLDVDVTTAHAQVSAGDLGPLVLKTRRENGDLVATADGPRLAGTLRIPDDNLAQRGITLRLDRLYWPESEDTPDEPARGSPLAPTAVPPLHVWVKDMRLGQAQLGEVRFESVPAADGMQVEQFEAQSPDVQVSARGRWTGSAGDNRSHLAIDLTAEDLGRMLTAFGYPRLVAGGTTLAHIDGRWPGPPSAFSLVGMDGTIKVHVTDGRILDVEPGMGRLFGLFSIRELPRRLSLDFGDIFKSGYSFNSIAGHLRFAGGSAWTDDLSMRGPAADIEIRGRTGLLQHDYDQQILVVPHLGVALPVVGAIAGGPIGAAAGLAAQGLLGKGLNRAGQALYRISGSWDKPDITLLARGQGARLSPARDTPAAASSRPPSPASTLPAASPAASVVRPAAASTATRP